MKLFLFSTPTTIHNSNPHPLHCFRNSLCHCVSGNSLLNFVIGVQWIRSSRVIYAVIVRIYSHHDDVFCLVPPIALTLMTNLKKSTANWRNSFAIDHESGAHNLEFSTALMPQLRGKERKDNRAHAPSLSLPAWHAICRYHDNRLRATQTHLCTLNLKCLFIEHSVERSWMGIVPYKTKSNLSFRE